MLMWKPKSPATLTIKSGRSYTEQGGYPVPHAKRLLGFQAALKTTVNDSTTTVVVSGEEAWKFPVGTEFLIGTELFYVEANSSGSMTVATRGYGSTTPAAHTAGDTLTVTLTGDGVIDVSGIPWASIITPAAWTAANLAAFCCPTRTGTFVPMRDETGVILQITTIATGAAASYYVPGRVLAGGPFIKFRSIAAGTDPTVAVTQAADRTLQFVCGA